MVVWTTDISQIEHRKETDTKWSLALKTQSLLPVVYFLQQGHRYKGSQTVPTNTSRNQVFRILEARKDIFVQTVTTTERFN